MAMEMKVVLPQVLLVRLSNRQWLSSKGLQKVQEFAVGIGPHKRFLQVKPAIVEWAHQASLSVTSFTFRSSALGRGFSEVRDEMAYYLDTLNVDALFTDNPDQFPRK